MPKEKDNFQNKMKRLDNLVNALQDTDIDIEESLKKFKEGVVLIKDCRQELKKAENAFVELKKELEEEE